MMRTMMRWLLLVCLLRPAWTFDEDGRSRRLSRGVRGRRRAYGINDYNLFVSNPSAESGLDSEVYATHVEDETGATGMAPSNDLANQTIDDGGDGWRGSASASAANSTGSASSPKGSHSSEDHNHTGSFGKGGSKSTPSKKGSKSAPSLKLPPLPVPKLFPSKGSKKAKAPHAAKKKLPPPKGSSGSKKASKAHKSKGVAYPTLSPAPSLRPIIADMPTINSPPSKEPPADSVNVSLAPYAILYSLDLTRIPLDEEVNQVVSLTAKYLGNRFEAVYPAMLEMDTKLEAKQLVSPVKPFIMNYTSVAAFSGGDVPTKGELEVVLARAFTQNGKEAYLELLRQQLAQDNIFATTNDITFRTEIPEDAKGDSESPSGAGGEDSGEEAGAEANNDTDASGSNFPAVIAGAASATVAAAIILAATAAHLSRKRNSKDIDENRDIPRAFKGGSGISCESETVAETTVESMATASVRTDYDLTPRQSDADDDTAWTMDAMSVIFDNEDDDEDDRGVGECSTSYPSHSATDEGCHARNSSQSEAAERILIHPATPEQQVQDDRVPYEEQTTTLKTSHAFVKHTPSNSDKPRVADLIKMFSKA